MLSRLNRETLTIQSIQISNTAIQKCHGLFVVTLVMSVPKCFKFTVWFIQQGGGRIVLGNVSCIHNQNLGAVDNSIETMSDCQHGAVLEFDTNHLLNESVRRLIDGCSRLVHNKNLRATQKSSSDANKLHSNRQQFHQHKAHHQKHSIQELHVH